VGNVEAVKSALVRIDKAGPAAVANLTAPSSTTTSVTLTWSNPTDNGSGNASYDVRYRVGSTFVEADWAGAINPTGEPTPPTTGMTVGGLSCNTTYTFALKTVDVAGNVSVISNAVTQSAAACPNVAIALSFDGQIRDRVGQGNLARNPDGQLDGTFTVTLNAGSGNRTVTQLQMTNSGGGVWNTQGGDGFWTLGVANGWDAALVNGSNDAVNLPVVAGGNFNVFAADYQNAMYLVGRVFTLTATFSDGSTAAGNATIP
jgi:hypothetical protein